MNEFDIEYWENVLALAKNASEQTGMQMIVESCFHPGVIEPGQSLDERINAARKPLQTIVKDIESLMKSIPEDRYMELRRAALAGIKLRSLSLMGESVPLNDELSQVYGLQVEMVTDDGINNVKRILDNEVPFKGKGNLEERWQMYLDIFRVPELANDTVLSRQIIHDLIKIGHDIARERFEPDLVKEENFDLIVRQDAPYDGRYIFHNPGKRSFEAVIATGTTVKPLAYQLSIIMHELYPGHHCQMSRQFETAEREDIGMLYGFVAPGPYVTITEGLGNNAGRVTISDEERAEIIAPFYRKLGKNVTVDDIRMYIRLNSIRRQATQSVVDNAAFFLLDERRPEDEVGRYLKDYGLMTQDEASGNIWFINNLRGYAVVYRTGEKLYREWLESLGGLPEQRIGYAHLSRNIIMPNQLSGTTIGK